MHPAPRPVLFIVVVALISSPIAVGTAGAAPADPNFRAYVSDRVIEPGSDVTVSVHLVNDAGDPEEKVRTAGNVRAELRSGNTPLTVRSGVRIVGDMNDGAVTAVEFRLGVPHDIDSGTYSVPIRLTYEDEGEEKTTTVHVEVRVEERPRFSVVAANSTVSIGGTGSIEVVLANTGSDVAHDTTVGVSAPDPEFSVGTGAAGGEAFLGRLAPGERKRLRVSARVAPAALRRNYSLRGAVTYRDSSGQRRSGSVVFPVRPGPRQSFAVVDVVATAGIDDSGRLLLELRNEGPDPVGDSTVTVASNDADISFADGALESASHTGRWEPGDTKEVVSRITVAEHALRRNYSLTASVHYRDTEDRRRSESVVFPVRPDPRQSFDVVDVATTAAIGGSGTLVLELQNEGPVTAYGSTVTVASDDADIGFAEGARESASHTGRWEPGDTKEVASRVTVAEHALRRSYSIRATVRYEDAEGRERAPRTVRVAVEPRPEQTFEVRTAESSLRVGGDGEVSAEVVNTGVSRVDDVVVAMRIAGTNLTPRVPERPVGTLAPGEGANVSFGVAIPDGMDAGTYRSVFDIRYETAGNEVRQADRIEADVEIAEWRPAFTVEPTNATFQVDSSGTLALSVTNNRDERVSDLVAVLKPTGPLSSDDASTFVPILAPGETARLTFHLDVSNDALPKTHPTRVEISYTEGDGTTRTAGPYRVPVTVVSQPGSGFPILPAVAMIVVVAVAVAWWRYRRE